jgi:hypothetical protein
MTEHAEIEIRRALPQGTQEIWRIIGPIIRAGETYALPRDLSEQTALRPEWDHEGHVAGTKR